MLTRCTRTASSAEADPGLRIEAGRYRLAGRITSLELGPLLLREISELRFGQTFHPFWGENGLEAVATLDVWRGAAASAFRESEPRSAAFKAFSQRGGYPIAHERHDITWPESADYLEDHVVLTDPRIVAISLSFLLWLK